MKTCLIRRKNLSQNLSSPLAKFKPNVSCKMPSTHKFVLKLKYLGFFKQVETNNQPSQFLWREEINVGNIYHLQKFWTFIADGKKQRWGCEKEREKLTFRKELKTSKDIITHNIMKRPYHFAYNICRKHVAGITFFYFQALNSYLQSVCSALILV